MQKEKKVFCEKQVVCDIVDEIKWIGKQGMDYRVSDAFTLDHLSLNDG